MRKEFSKKKAAREQAFKEAEARRKADEAKEKMDEKNQRTKLLAETEEIEAAAKKVK